MPPRLAEALPRFADELARLLAEAEPALAPQVATLRLYGPCTCGESSCATFYTAPPPDGPYGPGHRTLHLDRARGIVVLDVLDDRIVAVEALYRPDVQGPLRARFS